MTLYISFSGFFSAALASWLLLRFFIPWLNLRILDQPNSRSSHLLPTASGGGFAFVLVTCLASLLACFLSIGSNSVSLPLFFAPLLAFPLSVVGFLDDRYNLPATWRYLVQLATAFLIIGSSHLFVSTVFSLPLFVFLLVAVTAVINFTNFMDGLDGLVAGCMIVLISTASISLDAPWSMWCLVGSLSGFLIWNWSPAKVFMGDVGSTFLGAVFVALAFQSNTWLDALSLLLVASPLLGDACICVVRRFINGQFVFKAHRLHLFQRLNQAGWSHSQVALLYVSATLFLSLALLLSGINFLVLVLLIEFVIAIWLDQRVAVPFSFSSLN